MSALIHIFPVARRVGKVRKTARAMAINSAVWAEKHLQAQHQYIAESLARYGVPPDEITAHWRAFDTAVRAELWRLRQHPQRPNGAA